MVLNRNVMEPIVKNIPEFKIFYFCSVRTISFHPECICSELDGKKTFRTENRIILTSGFFEKRSPKQMALIINI